MAASDLEFLLNMRMPVNPDTNVRSRSDKLFQMRRISRIERATTVLWIDALIRWRMMRGDDDGLVGIVITGL